MSDVDALTMLLTVEGLLFAAFGIVMGVAAPGVGGGQNLPINPRMLLLILAAGLVGVGACVGGVWFDAFVGGDYVGMGRVFVAGGVLLATAVQTVVGAVVLVGAVKR